MSFTVVRANKKIQLPPYYLLNVLEGIEQQLNNKVMRCSDSLEGLILSFDNINVLGSVSHIVDDNPFLFVDIEVDFLLLLLKKGEIIKGEVTSYTNKRINLLVYNTFTARIEPPPELMQNRNFKKWLFENGRVIQFVIEKAEYLFKKDMTDITGSLPEERKTEVGAFDEQQNFVSLKDILNGKEPADRRALTNSPESPDIQSMSDNEDIGVKEEEHVTPSRMVTIHDDDSDDDSDKPMKREHLDQTEVAIKEKKPKKKSKIKKDKSRESRKKDKSSESARKTRKHTKEIDEKSQGIKKKRKKRKLDRGEEDKKKRKKKKMKITS